MLRRIFIDNYRCFVNFEFHPARMNLLLGDNGTGKSNLFGVLIRLKQLLCQGQRVQEVFPTVDLTAWDARQVQRFELEIEGGGGIYKYALEVEHRRDDSSASIRMERLEHGGHLLYRHEGPQIEIYTDTGALESAFSATTEESFLAILEPRPQNQLIGWFQRYMAKMALFRFNPRAIRGESVREEPELSNEGDNFASFYRNLQQAHPDVVPELTAALRRILPGYKGMKVVGSRKRELIAEFWSDPAQQGRVHELEFFELSDGQIMLIILYSLLYTVCRQERLVCFDEPDNYVALREIQPWLVALNESTAESGGQVMIISHSPEVIDYLAADTAWEFLRTGGQARVRPLQVQREAGVPASRWILERLGEP